MSNRRKIHQYNSPIVELICLFFWTLENYARNKRDANNWEANNIRDVNKTSEASNRMDACKSREARNNRDTNAMQLAKTPATAGTQATTGTSASGRLQQWKSQKQALGSANKSRDTSMKNASICSSKRGDANNSSDNRRQQ